MTKPKTPATPKKSPAKKQAGVAQSAERSPSKSQVAGSSPAPRSKPDVRPRRADKEAVERDYRTSPLTLREMTAKHGVSHVTIIKWAKQEGWVRGDLSKVVREATTALLVADTVKQEVNRVKNGLSAGVLKEAEAGKEVILGHRADLVALRDIAMDMAAELRATTRDKESLDALFKRAASEMSGLELVAFGQQVKDLVRLHGRVGSIHKLADTLAKLQERERRAHNLDDDGKGGGATSWDDMVGDIAGEIGA